MELEIGVPLFRFVTRLGTIDEYAQALGDLSSVCFFLVYVPQFVLNCRRRSVAGFSLSSVVLKLVGSAFLFVNSVFKEASFPFIFYGLLNTVEHCLFLGQFAVYDKHFSALLLISVILIPYFICQYLPHWVKWTNLVKPGTQFLSNFPQLYHCVRVHTTTGLSMYGQHLHWLGSLFGFMMLIVEQNFSFMPWLLYANSFLQAYLIYVMAAWYGELRFSDESREEIAKDEADDSVHVVDNSSDSEP
jgi:hypothetical protein